MSEAQTTTEPSPESELDQEEELKRLRNRLSRIEDWKEHVLMSRLEEKDERIAELEQTVAEQQGRLHALETELEAILGVDDGEKSTPEDRARDLRGAMIRSLQNSGSDRDGITWWWKEVRDHLSTLGHDGFSKPTYYAAMEDAVEGGEGFDETKKVVVEDDRTKTVQAIRLKVDDLPGELASNQLTTQSGAPSASDGASSVTQETETDD